MRAMYEAVLQADKDGIRPRETRDALGITNARMSQIRHRLKSMGYVLHDWTAADRKPVRKADMSDGKLPPDVEGPRCPKCHLLLPCAPCPSDVELYARQRLQREPSGNYETMTETSGSVFKRQLP